MSPTPTMGSQSVSEKKQRKHQILLLGHSGITYNYTKTWKNRQSTHGIQIEHSKEMEEERRNRPDDGATGGGKETGYASSATTGATIVKVECIFMATIGIKLCHPGDRWDTLYCGQRVGRAS